MVLVHTTLLSNLESIKEFGILCSYARGRKAAVWVHDESWNEAAEDHVRQMHEAAGEDLIHLYCLIPDEEVKRHGRQLYYTFNDISPSQIYRATVVRRVVDEIAF